MSDQLLWYTTRAAGAVSLILLSGVVVLGLVAARDHRPVRAVRRRGRRLAARRGSGRPAGARAPHRLRAGPVEARALSSPGLLAGPDPALGAEDFAAHTTRLGPLPPFGADIIAELERSELRGRGGAAFPVATKWRAVAAHR